MPGRKTILLAEDNTDEREMVATLLEASGYKVVAVADGKQAIDSLKKTRFDLILLDIMMPKVDGVEICNVLKHSRRLCRTPVVILSALAQGSPASEERWRQDTLADAFVAKPFDIRRLLAVIETLLTQELEDDAIKEKSKRQAHLRNLGHLLTAKDAARAARVKGQGYKIYLPRSPGGRRSK